MVRRSATSTLRFASRNVATRVHGHRDARCAPPRMRTTHRPTMTPITFGADRYFSSICSPRRRAVFRRQQAALLGEDHPAIAPPVRQHALVVDEVVALLGGEDARMRFIERIEKGVVGVAEQIVAEIVGGVAPHRHADRVEFAVDLVVIDQPAARGLMQPRQRAGEVGDAGERELNRRRWWTCSPRSLGQTIDVVSAPRRITMIYQRLAKVFLICSDPAEHPSRAGSRP